jgi:hypothetical protein
VEASRYPPIAQAAPAAAANGPANITANAPPTARPAPSTYGRRGPIRVVVRSLTRPATGFSSTVHALAANTSAPASPAATPRVSVR